MDPEKSVSRVLGIGIAVAGATERTGKKALAVGFPILIDFVHRGRAPAPQVSEGDVAAPAQLRDVGEFQSRPSAVSTPFASMIANSGVVRLASSEVIHAQLTDAN